MSTLEHARALLAAGNTAEAVSVLAPLLSRPDTGPEALVTTARCHQAMGDFAKAADAYALLLKGFPNSDLISRDLRLTFLECQILAKRWPEAIALAGECVKVHPAEAALWHFKAAACEVQRQDYARAIADLKKGAESARLPKDAAILKEIHTMLAGCYQMAEEWPELAAHAAGMVATYPRDAAVWQLRASMGYERTGQYDKAIEALEAGLKAAADSKDAALVSELGVRLPQMYRLSGKTAEAEELLLQLAREHPADAPVHLFWHAMCSKNRREYATAAERFQQVADKYPDHLMGKNALMEVYGCLIMVPGRKAEAEAAFQKLWDEYPDFRPEALFIKAEVMAQTVCDYSEAEACLERLLNEYPGHSVSTRSEFSALRVMVYRKLGRPAEAAETLLELAESAPNDHRKAMHLCNAGRLLHTAGQHSREKRTYARILELGEASGEDRATSVLLTAECCWQQGLRRSARAHMRRLVAEFPETASAREAQAFLDSQAK